MSVATRTKSFSRSRRRGRILNEIFLWFVLFIFFIPVLWIILTSVRIRSEINAFPPVWIPSGFSFDSYKILFGMPTPEGAFGLGGSIPVGDYARNSIVISLVSTLFALVLGTAAGFVFARFKFRYKNGTFLAMMLFRAIPGIALSLPLFILYARLGLSDTVPGMILIYVALNIPFTAWLMDGFFRAIPEELEDAARIDGCSHWGAFVRVDLPLALPGAAAAGIFAFLTSWNEFALASIITRTPASRTFPPALFEFTGQFVSDWRGMTAMSVLMLIPAVIFVAIVQRQLMEGLTSGATKG
ncbi:MAG: carbohydrate ABC transporter permease [Caldilineae bacterium]|nr:MAG: carbohydrate ABC transporter permease [Caldilineae bacterium]